MKRNIAIGGGILFIMISSLACIRSAPQSLFSGSTPVSASATQAQPTKTFQTSTPTVGGFFPLPSPTPTSPALAVSATPPAIATEAAATPTARKSAAKPTKTSKKAVVPTNTAAPLAAAPSQPPAPSQTPVPTRTPALTSSPAAKASLQLLGAAELPAPQTYRLHRGEYPWCIARRYNVNPYEMIWLNGIYFWQTYYPGQLLILPQTGNPYPGARMLHNIPSTYEVNKQGETIRSLACYFGALDPKAIAELNGINPDKILKKGTLINLGMPLETAPALGLPPIGTPAP